MIMAKKYISYGRLSIASKLFDFINNDLLPDTGITKGNFWRGLDKYAHELAPQNKNLLEFREILQKKADEKKISLSAYCREELLKTTINNYDLPL